MAEPPTSRKRAIGHPPINFSKGGGKVQERARLLQGPERRVEFLHLRTWTIANAFCYGCSGFKDHLPVEADVKTWKFIAVSREEIEEALKALNIRAKVLAWRSNGKWNMLLAREEVVKTLARIVLTFKTLRLQTEYMGTRKTGITLHGVSMYITEDHLELFLDYDPVESWWHWPDLSSTRPPLLGLWCLLSPCKVVSDQESGTTVSTNIKAAQGGSTKEGPQ